MLVWGILPVRRVESLCLQVTSDCVAMIRKTSMSRAWTGAEVVRGLLLLGMGLLAFLSGATAHTCTIGSKAVALFVPCAILVSKRPP
jgi:hypothetical protein